ncbi:hypothetical protein Tco_0834122 [Tanacetum coccineum]
MYLTSSRPDIMFAVCACVRFQVNPKSLHLYVVKRIFRYLKGQPKLGLWYPKDSPFDLVAYTDSDYAGVSLDRKSTTRGCQFLRDSNEKKLIQMIKIHTDQNVTDLLTKAFDSGKAAKDEIQVSVVGLTFYWYNLLLPVQVNAIEGDFINTLIQDTSPSGWEEELERMGAKTTAWNEFSSTMAFAVICLATNQKFNFSKYIFDNMVKNLEGGVKFLMYPSVHTHSNDLLLSGEDRLKLMELMELFTKLSERVLALETTKTNQALEIDSLKRRVGRSARVVSSEDEGLGAQEDASKQGRKIDEIDQDAKVTLVDETQGRYGDNLMFDIGVLDNEQDMAKKEVDMAKKDVSTVDPVITAGEVVSTANVVVSTAEVTTNSATTTIVDEFTLAQTLIEIKSAKPKVVTTTATTTTTAVTRPKAREVVVQEPKERLARQKEEDANIVKWDNVQAMIDADYELAARLQAQEQKELTIKEGSKMFVELMDKRKKHFMLFDKEMKRVNTFVDMDTELVKGSETRTEGSSKRAGEELESKNLKKQKLDENVEAEVDDDQEEAKMKKHMEIVPDDEVAIDVIPLATKPPITIDWKIIKKGNMGYFQIIIADGSLKRPEEGYKRVLWGDLKVMVEPNVESKVWRNLQGHKVTVWKLFSSSRVHFVRFQNMHIFMLVEKNYPLTPATIIEMLNKKLQADHWNEMCYQLLKLMTKQLKNPRSI